MRRRCGLRSLRGRGSLTRKPILPHLKVERRLLWVLGSCALVPIGMLCILSMRDGMFAALGGLETPLVLAVLLSLCLVALFSVGRIHKGLQPLEKLLAEARRVAGKDEREEAVAAPGDEFEELAGHFNQVSGRLSQHVSSLEKLIDIDHAIHSASDSRGIIRVAIRRIHDLCECDAVSMMLLRPEHPDLLQIFSAQEGDGEIGLTECPGFTPEESRELTANPDSLWIPLDDEAPGYLSGFGGERVKQVLLLPIFIADQFTGIVALGFRGASRQYPEAAVYLRQLVDQVGVALDNVRVVQENRVLSYYDSVTGLPNRRMYKDRLTHAIQRARRRDETVGVCLLDLDGFQRINETLGHEGGDTLLREISKRLLNCVRYSDAVARSEDMQEAEELSPPVSRLGGDEFTLLLTEMSEPQDALRVARRVLESFSTPFKVEGRELFCTASIGISVFPSDGGDAETLLRNADTAMYCAKRRGRNNFQFYAKSMNAEASRKLHLETRMRQGLERRDFSLHYQPLLEASSGRLLGAEALIRWDDPEMGSVRPVEFIPIAEETGFICSMGDWALHVACEQCRTWEAAGLGSIRIAVNLSGHQLRQPGLVDNVRQVLRETGLPPERLELELTESTVMQDDEMTSTALKQIREMGVGLALDDFGTGYSSLSYLRRFSLTHVKIDRSFVAEIPGNRNDASLTAAIIAMAHGLDLKVVAEGVETPAQRDFLRERGCDELQGYLFGKPVPAGEFVRFLRPGNDDGEE